MNEKLKEEYDKMLNSSLDISSLNISSLNMKYAKKVNFFKTNDLILEKIPQKLLLMYYRLIYKILDNFLTINIKRQMVIVVR